MLLTVIVSPRTDGLGMALAILVGNILSLAILEWAVMPLELPEPAIPFRR
jgi:antibiotic biosynthesis monooxygenase (ABM) superfamily enzyme